MKTFKTKSEAQAAGFVRVSHRMFKYRDMYLYSADTSGGSSRGYSFELRLSAGQDDWAYDETYLQKAEFLNSLLAEAGLTKSASGYGYSFGSSQQIWLTDELNQIKQPGCFSVVYHQDVLNAAIEKATAIIDAYRAVYPE